MRYASDAVALAMQREAQKRVLDMENKSRRMTQTANVLRPIEVPRLNEERRPPEKAFEEHSPHQPPKGGSAPQKQPPQKQEKRQSGDIRSLFEGLFSSQGQGTFSSLGDSLQKAVGQASSPASKLLDSFGIGGEELLILMVMYMVFKEHGDAPLLLALGYLLL